MVGCVNFTIKTLDAKTFTQVSNMANRVNRSIAVKVDNSYLGVMRNSGDWEELLATPLKVSMIDRVAFHAVDEKRPGSIDFAKRYLKKR